MVLCINSVFNKPFENIVSLELIPDIKSDKWLDISIYMYFNRSFECVVVATIHCPCVWCVACFRRECSLEPQRCIIMYYIYYICSERTGDSYSYMYSDVFSSHCDFHSTSYIEHSKVVLVVAWWRCMLCEVFVSDVFTLCSECERVVFTFHFPR